MVRVRLGSTWKQDPALRIAFARGARDVQRAAAEVVDAVALEVDGVDVAAGRAEGTLIAAVESLGEGALRVLAGGSSAQVHFAEGGVDLLVRRRGVSALITVVTLSRPARVLARDVEVDLADLVRAIADAARALGDDLASLHPAAGPATRGLRRLAGRLAAAQPAPTGPPPPAAPSPAHRPRRHRDAPTCSFELHDDDALVASYRGPGADLGSLLPPGRVVVHAPDRRIAFSVDGAPFLILRDLAAFAAHIADAAQGSERRLAIDLAAPGRRATLRLEVDLEAGTAAVDSAPGVPCPPLLLARALLEGTIDFCGIIVARNARQAENGWLAELRAGAAERLAHVNEILAGDLVAHGRAAIRARHAPRPPAAPLSPGRLRRLSFHRAWEVDVGAPVGFGIAMADELLLAAGAAAVLGLDARSGEARWRRPGAAFAGLAGDTVVVAGATHLAALDVGTGLQRWARPRSDLPETGIRDVIRLAGGALLLVAPGLAVALHPASGKTLWCFAPPAALDLRAAALGPTALIGGDAGFLYGLDAASGAVAWRLCLPGPLAGPPLVLGGACLALCTTDRGGSLLSLDPASGRRRFELPLDVAPVGAPITFAGLVGVVGMVAGDGVVIAIDPAGTLAWEDAPPLAPGPLVLAPLRSGVLAKAPSGTCVALDRDGAVLWTHGREGGHPPPANAEPVVLRGVALVPSETLTALDAVTGRPLGHARITAPVRLLADGELNAWGLDAEGLVTAVRLRTHLSVL